MSNVVQFPRRTDPDPVEQQPEIEQVARIVFVQPAPPPPPSTGAKVVFLAVCCLIGLIVGLSIV